MPNYQLGQIYMVYSIENPEDRYYGSTIQPLYKRFFVHKTEHFRKIDGKRKRGCSSSQLFEKYGEEGLKIELVEKFPCNSKEELEAREGHYIRTNKCVNKNIPLSEGETYYIRYKDKVAKYQAKNREKISEQQKQKYQNMEVVECECGMNMKKCHLNRHLNGKYHLDKLNSKK